MRTMLTLTVTALLVTPGGLAAQDYTSEEQALLERMESCWDLTVAQDLAAWVDECAHPEMLYWWDTASPIDIDFQRKSNGVHTGIDWLLADLRPLRVAIHGDIATVYLHGTWAWRDESGTITQQEDRRLEVWARENGRWMLLRGMGNSL